MSSGDAYRVKAAEMNAKASQEANPVVRAEFKKLAMAYLILADQADSNAKTDVVYETPERSTVHILPVVHPPEQQQPQQQQQQPPPGKKT